MRLPHKKGSWVEKKEKWIKKLRGGHGKKSSNLSIFPRPGPVLQSENMFSRDRILTMTSNTEIYKPSVKKTRICVHIVVLLCFPVPVIILWAGALIGVSLERGALYLTG